MEDIIFFWERFKANIFSIFFDGYCLWKKYFGGREKTENENKIQRLHFEVTNICNSRCRFCIYSKKMPRRLGIMDFDIFKKAIDEFGGMGGKIVSFTPTIGEPLMDPGLIQKIKYALSLPSIEHVYFYTNGTLLLKDENYKKLIDIGISNIQISISACDEDLFKDIEQIDLYRQTIDGIHNLLQYNVLKGEKTRIGINFRSPVLPSKIFKSPDFRKYIKPFLSPMVSCSFMAGYDNWCGNISDSDLRGVMKLRRINKIKYLPCWRTYGAIVLFDGQVRMCACRIKDSEFDELIIGDIRNDHFKNIINSEKAKEIRESFLHGAPPPVCRNCSLYIPFIYEDENIIDIKKP